MAIITKLEFQKRRKNRVSLFLDDEFFCGIPSIVVGEQRLKVGDNVDAVGLRKLIIDADREEAWSHALDYATRRLHTVKEIRAYLQSKEYQQEAIDEAIDKLREYGYVDEDAYLKAYIADHFARCGRNKLSYDLRLKGFQSDKIEAALSGLDFSDPCKRLAEKYVGGKDLDLKLKMKLQNYLYNRGYDRDVITEIVGDMTDES